MLTAACTKTVQHQAPEHAPQRCNIRTAVMHQNGATSATFKTDDLAPVGVQHQAPEHAPQRCKVSCTILVQHRKTELTYVSTDNRSRHALACKTVDLPYRNLTANHLDQTSPRVNQQTARAESEVGR